MTNNTEYTKQELQAIAITYAMDAMKREWKSALKENDMRAAEHYWEMWLAYKSINEEQDTDTTDTTSGDKYTVKLSRLKVCDLLLATTSIVWDHKKELADADCDTYRKEHVIPATIRKWQALHDEIEAQLNEQDKKQSWYKEA